MNDFKQLIVYQKAYTLSRDLWIDLEKIKEHRLKSQLFGAVTSIPANLAEMVAFDTVNHKCHKLRIAIGEANEAEFWLDLCKDTNALDTQKYASYLNRIVEIRKMLLGMLKTINNGSKKTI